MLYRLAKQKRWSSILKTKPRCALAFIGLFYATKIYLVYSYWQYKQDDGKKPNPDNWREVNSIDLDGRAPKLLFCSNPKDAYSSGIQTKKRAALLDSSILFLL